jgi:TonB family protein
MRKILSLSMMGALLWSAPAASEPTARPPTDRWVVDFDDAQCVAMRNYGTKESPFVLALKQPALGDVMQLSVVRRGTGQRFAEQHDASISLDGGKPIELTVVSAAVKQSGNVVVRTNIPRSTFDLVSHAKTIRIKAKDQLDESFQLSQVDGVLKVLDQCVVDLRRVWNVIDQASPPQKATLKKHASGSIAGLISPYDYPGAALDEDQRGTVSYALLIDEKGKVADCTVIETSGVAALDAQSCATIKARAQFVPAVDLDGKPAKDATTGKVTWDIR